MASVLRVVDGAIVRPLQELAQRTGRSKTYTLVEAIREHIDDLEDLVLSEQRLTANRAGESESIALEEVMKRYGLEN